MKSQLSRQNLDKIFKELDETSVAVSVVGTRRQKLMDLARMVLPVRDALFGTRPEVSKVRSNLTRAMHNVRRAQLQPRPASKAIKALAVEIVEVKKLLASKLGDVPETFALGGMTVQNVWGYTEGEGRQFIERMKRSLDKAKSLGIDGLEYGDVVFDPEMTQGAAVSYDPHLDRIYANPSKVSNRADIGEVLASRMWLSVFGPKEHIDWGGSRGFDGFVRIFSDMLSGKKIDRGIAGIMAATAGVEHEDISEQIIPSVASSHTDGSCGEHSTTVKTKGVRLTPLAVEKAIESMRDGSGRNLFGFYVKVGNVSYGSGPGFVTVRANGEKDSVTFYSIGPKTAARRASRYIYSAARNTVKKGGEEAE